MLGVSQGPGARTGLVLGQKAFSMEAWDVPYRRWFQVLPTWSYASEG